MLADVSCKFAPLFGNKYQYYGFYGGRGSGKSHAVALYAIISSLQSKENIVTVRQFKNSLDDSCYKLYEDKITQLGLKEKFSFSKRSIECKVTGSKFNFLGVERNTDSLRSLNDVTLTIIEEAQNIGEYSFRVLTESVMRSKKSRIVCVWNPIYPTDVVDAFFRGENRINDSYSCEVNYKDNSFFDQTNLKKLQERDKKINESRYRHIWEGAYFNVMNARIFTSVNYGTPVISPKAKAYYGVDFGSTDPNTFVKLYVLENNTIYVDRAFKCVCSLSELKNYIIDHLNDPFDEVICDNAWAQSIEMLRSLGINAKSCKKGNNSILTGIDWLQGYTILLHPSAKALMEEAENYTWRIDRKRLNPDGTPCILKEPIDAHNHLWDAVRYATESFRLQRHEPQIFGVNV